MRNKYSVFSLIKNALSYHENWQRAWKDPAPKKEYDAVIVGGVDDDPATGTGTSTGTGSSTSTSTGTSTS